MRANTAKITQFWTTKPASSCAATKKRLFDWSLNARTKQEKIHEKKRLSGWAFVFGLLLIFTTRLMTLNIINSLFLIQIEAFNERANGCRELGDWSWMDINKTQWFKWSNWGRIQSIMWAIQSNRINYFICLDLLNLQPICSFFFHHTSH